MSVLPRSGLDHKILSSEGLSHRASSMRILVLSFLVLVAAIEHAQAQISREVRRPRGSYTVIDIDARLGPGTQSGALITVQR